MKYVNGLRLNDWKSNWIIQQFFIVIILHGPHQQSQWMKVCFKSYRKYKYLFVTESILNLYISIRF